MKKGTFVGKLIANIWISGSVAFGVALTGTVGPAFAAGGSGNRTPAYVEVMKSGAVMIQADTDWKNPDGCLDAHRIYIPASHPQLNKLYAVALTAYATQDYVWAWVNGCETMGWGDEYPRAVNLAVRVR